VPEYEARYHVVFEAIELFSLVTFTVEYALRVRIAVEHAPHRHLAASAARLKFLTSAARHHARACSLDRSRISAPRMHGICAFGAGRCDG
jgi:hypothetical protein